MSDAESNADAAPRRIWLRWMIFLGIIAAFAGFYALGLQE
jgi:hypothetical protein